MESPKERLQGGEGGGSDTVWSARVSAMEGGNLVRCVSKVLGWFPGVSAFVVAFPTDQVLELAAVNPAVQDVVDFVLLLIVDDDGVRWRRRGKAVVSPRCELIDVQDRVDLEERRKF